MVTKAVERVERLPEDHHRSLSLSGQKIHSTEMISTQKRRELIRELPDTLRPRMDIKHFDEPQWIVAKCLEIHPQLDDLKFLFICHYRITEVDEDI